MTEDELEPFKMLHASSTRGQLPASSQLPATTCLPTVAAKAATMLMGCYRKGDAADPEIYVTAIAAVLERYPARVVEEVSDPRTGIAGRSNWLPTVAEVRTECERLMAPSPAERWAAVEAATLARRLT